MRFYVLISLLAGCFTAEGQVPVSPAPTAEQEAALLKEVQVPDGFDAKIFAVPPAVNYPVFVAAAPDGTLYVSSDKNGSLDRGPNRGRVLRVRDNDGDGHADEVKAFVPNVDSPRGLFWDRDRLYLLHPPHLSAFIDRDGDGIAEEQKILVKNIAFTFKDRPADHSSNGIELGVDGWIYCAIGDFGFLEAEGTDGRKLQLRAGGVVRVRPDGSGLELYSRGTRNILEACVSPTLDVFARDNTNDGDGWDIRLHHLTGLSEHGYPSLYKNFKGDFIEPLAEYGGGSGCGGLYLNEPGFPEGYGDTLYTADWGREWIYRHNLTPQGATFTASQDQFVRAPRVTDLDVDASSRVYVASWKGASYTYVGENVGFIVRVTPKGYTAPALPDFSSLAEADLISELKSPSHRRRLEAQRELLHRKPSSGARSQVESLAQDRSQPIATRLVALFLLKQSLGNESHPLIAGLLVDPSVREWAIRALCDQPAEIADVPVEKLAASASDGNARVRREVAFGLAHLGATSSASAIATMLGDQDPTVAHTAVQALRKLKAFEAAFAVLDAGAASSAGENKVAPVALIDATRVLYGLHEPAVVDGLIARLGRAKPAERPLILTALCRLFHTDGEWKGDSWGTRPDTSGPYYQASTWSESDRIAAALTAELQKSSGDETAFLVEELSRHKVQTDDILHRIISLAEADNKLLPAVVVQLARADNLPPRARQLLIEAATTENVPTPSRAHAVTALAKLNDADALKAMLQAIPEIAEYKGPGREAQQAKQAFLRMRHASQHVEFLENEAARRDPVTSIWADALLLNLSEGRNASAEAREKARKALDEGAKDPRRQIQILDAIALAEHRPSRERVLTAARFSSNPDVVKAATKAARALRIEKEIFKAEPEDEPLLSTLSVGDIITQVANVRGDRKLGEEVFARQTCNACHTMDSSEPLRGPFLGNIATIYKRDELARAILEPNATIAQGFSTHHFELNDGTEMDGFVVQEAADKVTIRNVAAQELQLKTADIAKRAKLETSLMPEGLVANLTLKDFASLLDYLQGSGKKATTP